MNTAGKTYLDILKEHYPNVVLNELYGYCPAGFFKYGMDMHHPDCSAQCDECWLCVADSEWCENGEYDVPKEWKTAAEQDKPSEPPAPTQTETAMPAVFDYSELDSDTAAKLENVTAEIFNVRKEYIFTMAKKVAYAHDLLANCGNGKFGAWCESIGITRQTGNNLIQIVKLFDNSTSEEQENLNKLADGNVKLLYEAARPSAPPELVEQVKSGDITTHKDYIALKKELEEANKKIELAEQQSESLKKVVNANKANYEKYLEERERNSELEKQLAEVADDLNELDEYRERNDELEERDDALQRKNDDLVLKNQELERRIRELESRPVDVAVQSDEEAISQKDEEIAELKEQLERLSDKDVKIFAIRLTLDEFEELIGIVKDNPTIKNAVTAAKILRV